MNSSNFRSPQFQSEKVDSLTVLVDWAGSLATFYTNYHKVEAWFQETTCNSGTSEHLSIYRRDTLLVLMRGMQAELQLLFQDMDHSFSCAAGGESYFNHKLATHAQYLTQLNQQAFLLLVERLPN